MCGFCTQHGDGKVWYKNARNYAQDLVSDLRRRTYIRQFLDKTIKDGFATLGRLEALHAKRGRIPEAVKNVMQETALREHFGQVLPMEEIRGLVMKARSVVRIPCACRWTINRDEQRCCYAVSYTPEAWYQGLDLAYFGRPPSQGLEEVGREQAVRQMEQLDEDGAVHTIWTMVTPFIGAVCNCTTRDCLALRTLAGIQVETLWRAEHVARVEVDACLGCGLCKARCLFGAISDQQDGDRFHAVVDRHKCFGCGLCRNVCGPGAITLVDRPPG